MTAKIRLIKDVLWLFALIGLVAGGFRLWFGLGATTNMSDAIPWGLWKILNMVAGVALSTGGFTVGFLVYVLRLKRLRPLMKPAIVVAFLGYGCSMLALLFDIGLPHRFWHPIVMWNEHSFLFEVFWCVLLYFTVTFIELSPTIFERLRAENLSRALHRAAFGVVVVGIALSSLHHSSLGSLFLVTPIRLHSLWYTPWLPLFFILSAMGAGMMFIVLIRILYARWYDPVPVFGLRGGSESAFVCQIEEGIGGPIRSTPRGKDLPILSQLASIAASVLGVYLMLKVIDLFRQDAWHALLAGTWESWLYAFELLIAAVLPILLIALPKTRRSPTGLGIAAFSASAGLALNRLDVGIFGYLRDAGTAYFPSWVEWALSAGVVAAAGLVFFFIVENFAVFDDNWKERLLRKGVFHAAFERWSHVWYTVLMSGLHRVTLIAVFAIPLAWILLYPPYHDSRRTDTAVQPAVGVDAMRTTLRIDGNRNGILTEFPHGDHQKRLGGEKSCINCHHVSLPQDKSTPCSRCHRDMVYATVIFDHPEHTQAVAEKEHFVGWYPSNHSCSVCHTPGQPKTSDNAKPCFECHKDDMWLVGQVDSTCDLMSASSFREAMHQTCILCHQRERVNVNKPDLAECFTCHVSLKPRSIAVASELDETIAAFSHSDQPR